MAIKVKDLLLPSAAILLVQMMLTGWIYPLFTRYGVGATQYLFSISPTTAIGSQSVGNKIVGYVSGYIPFDISNWAIWISMYIGVLLLVLIGVKVYESSFSWKGKSESQKLFAILLYGHVALFAVLMAMGMVGLGNISTGIILGLAVNLAVVSLVYTTLADRVSFFKFLRI